jgi:hypothetical protein
LFMHPRAPADFGWPGVVFSSNVGLALAASRAYYHPFIVSKQVTITGLMGRVSAFSSTAGAQVRFSVYAADEFWQPGVLLLDAGTVTVDVSNGVRSITGLSLVLPPGCYLGRLQTDASAAPPSFTSSRGSPISGTPILSSVINLRNTMSANVAWGPAESPGTAWVDTSGSSTPMAYVLLSQWTQ